MKAPMLGSLFSGIGGIDLAFERAGFKVAFQVEIDEFCQKVLQRHWPDVPRYGDIRAVTGRDLPAVDVLAGGFPCQPVSVAGRRKAQADERWLWPEFARLIGDLRPRFVFLENVPGILTAGGADVVTDLAALGYDAQWGIVAASDVGAPHRRERWWCVAYTHEYGRRQEFTGNQDGITSRRLELAYCNGARQSQPQRGLYGIGGRAEYSSEILGNTTSVRTSAVQQPGQLHSPQQTGSDIVAYAQPAKRRAGDTEASAVVGDSSLSAEWKKTTSWAGNGSAELADAQIKRHLQYGKRSEPVTPPARITSGSQDTNRVQNDWSTQSILGRATFRLSRQLDGAQWPARPGEAQRRWEAPRTATGVRNRTSRLKALGNAVVPQVVQPFAEAIREALAAEGSNVMEAQL